MAEVSFTSFPNSAEEAIAMLYIQNQDLSGKTPSEIYTMYHKAHIEIKKDKAQKSKTGWFTKQREEL